MPLNVSAVIPTIGRSSLGRAVRSALNQTHEVAEVIVVADTDGPIELPMDDRIILLRSGSVGSGPARCRQRGIDAATGSIIALLDDDDEWDPRKIERQLGAVASMASTHWIASSRISVLGPGSRRRTWPRRLIEPGESISEYLFRFSSFTVGGTALQTSSLCFPAELAREVRWDAHAGAVKDEPSWLLRVQHLIPDVQFVQLPEVLSTYNVHHSSRSRDTSDRTDEYIAWGREYLATAGPRVLGDYLCTSPVSAAVSARSLSGVRRSVRAAFRYGRPGPYALAYATLNAVRILLRRLAPTARP